MMPSVSRLKPIGFWSYAREADPDERLDQLRNDLGREIQRLYGRERIKLWQDVAAIPPGEEWERMIEDAINQSAFFIPILTPAYIESEWCCKEFMLFCDREKSILSQHPELARHRRIFPIEYVKIHDCIPFDPRIIDEINRIQKADFTRLRLADGDSADVRRFVSAVSDRVDTLLKMRVTPSETPAPSSDDPAQLTDPKPIHRNSAEVGPKQVDTADTSLLGRLRKLPRGAKIGSAILILAVAALGGLALWHGQRAHDGVPGASKSITIMEQACTGADKDGESCTALGLAYDAGRGVGKDEARGAHFYQLACDNNDAAGCFDLGVDYDHGIGVKASKVRASQLYEKACNAGDASACANFGINLAYGEAGVTDKPRALTLLDKACAGGNAIGCGQLGIAYDTGIGGPIDAGKAAIAYAKGCGLKDGLSCHNLGVDYENGIGVTPDNPKAAELYRQGCDLNDSRSCVFLADMYGKGKGVSQNITEAARLYAKACEAGDAKGCSRAN